jgi:hypothetical protein
MIFNFYIIHYSYNSCVLSSWANNLYYTPHNMLDTIAAPPPPFFSFSFLSLLGQRRGGRKNLESIVILLITNLVSLVLLEYKPLLISNMHIE